MGRVVWCMKQLLPLIYVTTFKEGGSPRLSIWRMWLGRCFNIRHFKLAV